MAGVPVTRLQAQRFLGFAQFYQRVLPHLAAASRQFIEETGRVGTFVLSQEALVCYCLIKQILEHVTLWIFDKDRKLFIIADGQPGGVGAVAYQFDDQGNERPLQFAAQSLTPKLRRKLAMFTTEVEAFALMFSVSRFS